MKKEFSDSFRIGDAKVGGGAPCYVIAEAGSNHNRDIDIAYKMIDVAAAAKADAVKFQTFTADKIASRADIDLTRIDFAGAKTLHSLFKDIELPREWQRELCEYAAEKGIIFMSTPFDEDAVESLYEIGVQAFKIASFELNHLPLLRCVAETGRPVLLSTGMAKIGEIEEALETLETAGCTDVGLFHCGIGYPMNPKDVNLRAMLTMMQAFPCPVGYSDHTLGLAVPTAAVACGAKMIEKHFTLDNSLPGPDHAFAIEPPDLMRMVENIRTVETAMGSFTKAPVESEFEYRERGRRSLFTKVAIPRGAVIESEMLEVLRPGAGLHPRYLEIVSDFVVTRDIGEHEPISWDCLKRRT